MGKGQDASLVRVGEVLVEFDQEISVRTEDFRKALSDFISGLDLPPGLILLPPDEILYRRAVFEIRATLHVEQAAIDRLVSSISCHNSVVAAALNETLTTSAIHPNQWHLYGKLTGYPYSTNVTLSHDRKSTVWNSTYLSPELDRLVAELQGLPPEPPLNIRGQGVTVAVIDSGVLNHPDLSANLLRGIDFNLSRKTVQPGTPYIEDGTDPGDWVDALKGGQPDLTVPPKEPSSWHGTHVSGIIAANGTSSGVAPEARILPIRSLGAAGGRDDQILAGIDWAVGYPTVGVTPHPYSVDIINMSLGSDWDGSGGKEPGRTQNLMYLNALKRARDKGILVVLAAGNRNMPVRFGNVAKYANWELPTGGTLDNVITVAASNHRGVMTFFSNYNDGPPVPPPPSNYSEYGRFSAIGVTAPGEHIWATINQGEREPLTSLGLPMGPNGIPDATHKYDLGTSMAAPIVSGAAALMICARREAGLSRPTPEKLIEWILESAKSRAPAEQINDIDPKTYSKGNLARKPGGGKYAECYDKSTNQPVWQKTRGRDLTSTTGELSFGAGLIDISKALDLALSN
ncbi:MULTISPECIES: S8 family serine peptidase [Streptomyces]|uniref:S8 family serine peptidase n=1 Tax=Streptomyces TaxID=1883 RepID=UPI00345B55D4